MLARIGQYKAALVLSATIALLELVFVGFVYVHGFSDSKLSLGRTAVAVAIIIGLWLISNIARWLGAAWYAVIVVILVYGTAINESIDNKFSTYWVFSLGLLCAAAVWLLVFSKGFREEFGTLRQARPRYKLMLGRLTTVVLVVIMIVPTAKDIWRVFSRFIS